MSRLEKLDQIAPLHVASAYRSLGLKQTWNGNGLLACLMCLGSEANAQRYIDMRASFVPEHRLLYLDGYLTGWAGQPVSPPRPRKSEWYLGIYDGNRCRKAIRSGRTVAGMKKILADN